MVWATSVKQFNRATIIGHNLAVVVIYKKGYDLSYVFWLTFYGFIYVVSNCEKLIIDKSKSKYLQVFVRKTLF